MKRLATSIAGLLVFAIAGCSNMPVHLHREARAKAPSLAPYLKPSQPLETQQVELPPTDRLLAGVPIYNMRIPAQPVRPPVHRRKLNGKNPEEAMNGGDAAANLSPGVDAIGELTEGDSGNLRGQTESSITATEHKLRGINRRLSESELKIADQIRSFLKQARTALNSGDVEGAHTLAVKAQVLLSELTR
jgi:hypothetical protein